MYCVILLGLAFMALPDNTEAIDFFLFNDVRLTFQTYVYFIFEHLGIISMNVITVAIFAMAIINRDGRL